MALSPAVAARVAAYKAQKAAKQVQAKKEAYLAQKRAPAAAPKPPVASRDLAAQVVVGQDDPLFLNTTRRGTIGLRSRRLLHQRCDVDLRWTPVIVGRGMKRD